MKNLKLIIILLILTVIVLISVISVLTIQNNNYNSSNNLGIDNDIKNNDKNEEIIGDAEKITFNTSVTENTSKSTLYSLSNNINKYFNYIKEGNTTAINELGGNNSYNITNNVNYTIRQAYCTENEYLSKYYTKGILSIAQGNHTATEQEVFIILYNSSENKGYKLEIVTEDEYNNMQELAEDESVNIIEGTYNLYEHEYVDNAKQMQIYLDYYSFQIFNNTEKAYNLLIESYRNKRFPTKSEFGKYISEKQNELADIELVEYNAEESSSYTIYKGTDENGNYYYIKETSYMEYTIILDSYTMQEDYSNATTEEKILKNTEKFILMLNSADYTNAYNLLEPTFKQNNFTTEESFISYIKTNWYKRNIISSKKVTDDGWCVVVIKDNLANSSNKMEKQFNLILGDGMNFTIEFNI